MYFLILYFELVIFICYPVLFLFGSDQVVDSPELTHVLLLEGVLLDLQSLDLLILILDRLD